MRTKCERLVCYCGMISFTFLAFLLYVDLSAHAEELKTEKILEDVEPENSFWLDNDTLILKKYFDNCGVHIIIFRSQKIVKKIDHTENWLPVANPLPDTIIFKMHGYDRDVFYNSSATSVGDRIFYAYNYKTGMLRKVFVANQEELFFYDNRRNEMYFQRTFTKYSNVLDVKCVSIGWIDSKMLVEIATDGNDIFVLNRHKNAIEVIQDGQEKSILQLTEKGKHFKVYSVVSAIGRILISGGYEDDRASLYSFSEKMGLTMMHGGSQGKLLGYYYAQSLDVVFVYAFTSEQKDSKTLYYISGDGERIPISTPAKVAFYHSVSPGGDKFLYFTEAEGKYGQRFNDANILYVRRSK